MLTRHLTLAVFCQGTPNNPEHDPDLKKLAGAVRESCNCYPDHQIRLLIFGPHTFDKDVSEAEAFLRCLLHDAPPLPDNVTVQKIEHTKRLREHVAALYGLLRPREEVWIVYEKSAAKQVLAQLERYYPTAQLDRYLSQEDQGNRPVIEIHGVDFNPNAQGWINRQVKQPLRELLDRLYYEHPNIFGLIDRFARWANVQFARLFNR